MLLPHACYDLYIHIQPYTFYGIFQTFGPCYTLYSTGAVYGSDYDDMRRNKSHPPLPPSILPHHVTSLILGHGACRYCCAWGAHWCCDGRQGGALHGGCEGHHPHVLGDVRQNAHRHDSCTLIAVPQSSPVESYLDWSYRHSPD